METYNSYLLSYLKYGDHDAILHCFTEDHGYLSFFAKGIYAAKNKKKPYLFPLNQLFITVSRRGSHDTMLRMSKIESTGSFYGDQNIAVSTVLFFVADFLNQVLRDEGANGRLFLEIESVREAISSRKADAYLAFIIRYLQISGVAPLPGSKPFLNPESGVFEEEISHTFFDEQVSAIWQQFLQADRIYDVTLKRSQRSAFLDSLMLYCQYHITGFHIPQSLAVVREIFD